MAGYTDNTISRTVARNMQTFRKARGWTAIKLAERMTAWGYPISAVTVRSIESGRRQVVTVDELVALSAIFDMPIDDLLDGSCSACEGKPPAGYTCNSCGKAGITA